MSEAVMTVVVERTPSPLVEALEANLHGHFAFVQRHLAGMVVDDRPDLLLVDSGLPTDTFNQIARARLEAPDADRRIEQALGYFRSVNRPFSWWVGPCSRPLDLERRLNDHGLRATESELAMAVDLADVPVAGSLPEGLLVKRVRTRAQLADFAAVLASDLDSDDPASAAVARFYECAAPVLLAARCPMRLYVGYVANVSAPGSAVGGRNGVAVATSELFLGAGVVGVYSVATVAGFRGRGIGTALTQHALTAARRQGLRSATLQASDAGRGVYARLDFRPVGRFVEYK